jgi:hypothetical protein
MRCVQTVKGLRFLLRLRGNSDSINPSPESKINFVNIDLSGRYLLSLVSVLIISLAWIRISPR